MPTAIILSNMKEPTTLPPCWSSARSMTRMVLHTQTWRREFIKSHKCIYVHSINMEGPRPVDTSILDRLAVLGPEERGLFSESEVESIRNLASLSWRSIFPHDYTMRNTQQTLWESLNDTDASVRSTVSTFLTNLKTEMNQQSDPERRGEQLYSSMTQYIDTLQKTLNGPITSEPPPGPAAPLLWRAMDRILDLFTESKVV